MSHKQNPIQYKAFQFAVGIVKFCHKYPRYFTSSILLTQLLKCSTSVGANVSYALVGQSKKDFLAKMYIAYKEINESVYWLEIMNASNLWTNQDIILQLRNKAIEIRKLLSAITKSTRENLK